MGMQEDEYSPLRAAAITDAASGALYSNAMYLWYIFHFRYTSHVIRSKKVVRGAIVFDSMAALAQALILYTAKRAS